MSGSWIGFEPVIRELQKGGEQMQRVTEQDLRVALGGTGEEMEPREELWNQIQAKSVADIQKRITTPWTMGADSISAVRPGLWSRLRLGPKLELAAACIVLVGFLGVAAVRNLHATEGQDPASGEQTQALTADAALHAVIASQEKLGSGTLAAFPKSIGKAACEIQLGGEGAEPTVVNGTCETKVDADGVNWVVSFVQTWGGKELHDGQSAFFFDHMMSSVKFKVDVNGNVEQKP